MADRIYVPERFRQYYDVMSAEDKKKYNKIWKEIENPNIFMNMLYPDTPFGIGSTGSTRPNDLNAQRARLENQYAQIIRDREAQEADDPYLRLPPQQRLIQQAEDARHPSERRIDIYNVTDIPTLEELQSYIDTKNTQQINRWHSALRQLLQRNPGFYGINLEGTTKRQIFHGIRIGEQRTEVQEAAAEALALLNKGRASIRQQQQNTERGYASGIPIYNQMLAYYNAFIKALDTCATLTEASTEEQQKNMAIAIFKPSQDLDKLLEQTTEQDARKARDYGLSGEPPRWQTDFKFKD